MSKRNDPIESKKDDDARDCDNIVMNTKEGKEKVTMSNSSNNNMEEKENVPTINESLPTISRSFSGPRTVGNDPNFLDSYFASSRLSFIGSFKQRLKAKASDVRPNSHREGARIFVFHVDMDCFFAAIAVRNYPQYKNKPVAVGHGWKNDPNGIRKDVSTFPQRSNDRRYSTSELSTCNYAARKFGVRKGMFAHRARQLCPDLVILPYDYEGYEMS